MSCKRGVTKLLNVLLMGDCVFVAGTPTVYLVYHASIELGAEARGTKKRVT